MSGTDAPIFIVGCPRSGTTLFRNLLRSHPRLTFPPETHFIARLYRMHGDPGDDSDAIRLAATILRLSWMRKWRLELDPEALRGCRRYADVVSAFFAAWGEREGKQRWGDKTPQYAVEIPTLREIFPLCQVIHCIRDGRDVALSYCRSPFGPGNVYTAAREWHRFVTTGRRDGAALPKHQYMEVRYETLLAAPDATVREVLAFLGEPPIDGAVRPNPIRRDPDAFASPGGISRTEIAVENTGKWKTQMPPSDRAVFEAVAGETLGDLGYEVEGLARPLSGAEVLFWRSQNLASVFIRRTLSGRLPGAILNEILLGRMRRSLNRS